MKKIKIYIFTIIGSVFILLNSCTDTQELSLYQSEGKTKIILNIHSENFDLPQSRADQADENTIGDLYVFVFKKTNTSLNIDPDAIFEEVIRVTGTSSTRIISLNEQTSACNLLFIANPQTYFCYGTDNTKRNFADIGTYINTLGNKTLGDFCDKLRTDILSSPEQTSVPFVNEKLPMSNILSVAEIKNDDTILTVNLTRIVAKLVVNHNIIPDFKVLGVTVFNVPTQGQYYRRNSSFITPGLTNYYGTSATPIEDISASAILKDEYNMDYGTTKNNPIYIYESAMNEAMIIIKAEYENVVGYHKLNFLEADNTPIDVLRNHSYNLRILHVNHHGFESLADALLAPFPTLTYTLTVDNSQNTYDIITNGYHFLAFNCSGIEVVGPPDKAQNLYAFEIITNATINYDNNHINLPQNSKMTVKDETNQTVNKIKLSPDGSFVSTHLIVTLNSGFAGSEDIEIKYGEFLYTLKVSNKNETPFTGPGGKIKIEEYNKAEITYSNYNGTIPDINEVYLTKGAGAVTTQNPALRLLQTYEKEFYFSVPATGSEKFHSLYVSSLDSFNGRKKLFLYQSR